MKNRLISKSACQHTNRINIESNKMPDHNFVLVKCLDCGCQRYESRYKNGRVDSSEWFKKRLK